MSRQVASKAQGNMGSHLSASYFLCSYSLRQTGGQWALKNTSNLQLHKKTAMKQKQTTTSRSVALSFQEQSCPPRPGWDIICLYLQLLMLYQSVHICFINSHPPHTVLYPPTPLMLNSLVFYIAFTGIWKQCKIPEFQCWHWISSLNRLPEHHHWNTLQLVTASSFFFFFSQNFFPLKFVSMLLPISGSNRL